MDMRLNAIAFDKYYGMLKCSCPQLAGMIVHDAHDQPVWINSDCRLSGATIEQLANSEGAIIPCPDGTTQEYRSFRYEIDTAGDASVARLLLVINTGSSQQHDVMMPSAGKTFAAVSELIRHEYQLHDEIDSMATELAERYEELNLIYHTDDQISDFSTGQKALKNIVEQCIRYLDVDLVILEVPNRGICLIESSNDCSVAGNLELIQHLQQTLLARMQREPIALTVNSNAQARQLHLDVDTQQKFVCSPVMVGDNRACGIFMLLKESTKSDFDSSQRNLLAVLERKVAKIIQQSYDNLTGLLNWSSFQQILETVLGNTPQQTENCLLMLDVNQLHVINDLGGFEAGDALLIQIAELLHLWFAHRGIIARQSGDVFAALLQDCDVAVAESLVRELQLSINKKGFTWLGEAFRININIGITPIQQGASTKTVISAAEHALAVAGEKGINRIEINRVSNHDTSARKNRVAWINRVNEALHNDRFDLHCQAICPTTNQSEPHHYEILIRMRDEEGSFVSPGNFIPAAEYYQLMPEIDRWVIQKTLKVLHNEWQTLSQFPLSFAINLSGQTVSDPEFKDFIIEQLENSKVPTDRLGFEVTETATVQKLADAQELLSTIKTFGCDIYLDDFGTGLSSFGYLKSLPFDYLKIDGSFIKQITEDPVSEAMVVAIKDMAQVTGLKTVAEFVENQEIIDCLEKIGIEYLQGYGLHAPESLENIVVHFKSLLAARAN
ncbi:MAG: EAL domain-containing protein [Pseudomonadales bacterium]